MSETRSSASKELGRVFSWNQVVPNLGFFEDQLTPNFDELQHNNKSIEGICRLLSEITLQSPSEDLPVFDNSNLTIGKSLGRGANAVVYDATLKKDELTHKVVVKIPTSEKNAIKEKSKTVRHVKQQMLLLRQPCFVEYYGIYIEPSTQMPCVVMQKLKGNRLSYHLDTSFSRISFKTKVNISLQIAKALQFAHSKGILVTDLKPDNIMFKEIPDLENNANIQICVIDVTENDCMYRL